MKKTMTWEDIRKQICDFASTEVYQGKEDDPLASLALPNKKCILEIRKELARRLGELMFCEPPAITGREETEVGDIADILYMQIREKLSEDVRSDMIDEQKEAAFQAFRQKKATIKERVDFAVKLMAEMDAMLLRH